MSFFTPKLQMEDSCWNGDIKTRIVDDQIDRRDPVALRTHIMFSIFLMPQYEGLALPITKEEAEEWQD